MTKPLLFFWDFGGLLGHAYYALNIQEPLYDKSFKLSEVLLEALRGHHSYFQDSATSLISNQSLNVFGSCNQCSMGICYFRQEHVLSQWGNCVTQQNYWWLHESLHHSYWGSSNRNRVIPFSQDPPNKRFVCLSYISYKCFCLLYVVFNMQDVLYLRTIHFSCGLEKQSLYLLLSCFENKDILVPLPSLSFFFTEFEEALNKSDIIWWESTNSTLQQRLWERFSWGQCVCGGRTVIKTDRQTAERIFRWRSRFFVSNGKTVGCRGDCRLTPTLIILGLLAVLCFTAQWSTPAAQTRISYNSESHFQQLFVWSSLSVNSSMINNINQCLVAWAEWKHLVCFIQWCLTIYILNSIYLKYAL